MKNLNIRIWDKRKKEMHSLITWHHPFYLDFCCYAIGQSSDSVVEIRHKDCVLMLSTGLKDSNKNLIFEKDIIEYSLSKTQHYKGVIKWGEKNCGFVIRYFYQKDDPFITSPGHIFQRKYLGTHLLNNNLYNIKILGNTFQNPNIINLKNLL